MPRWQKITITIMLGILIMLVLKQYYPNGIGIQNQEQAAKGIELEPNPEITLEGKNARIRGTVRNIGNTSLHRIEVKYIFENQEGIQIGEVAKIIKLSLKPNESKEYDLSCELSEIPYKRYKGTVTGWYTTTGI